MSQELGRREVLRATLGFSVIAGLGAASALGALPAEAASRAYQDFPPVPGMHGDRRANEFWYQFDNATLFDQAPAVTAAFVAIQQYFADVLAPHYASFVDFWITISKSAAFPGNYTALMAPLRPQLEVLSRTEATVFDAFYRPHDPRLVAAFSWFGQGVLYDPRHTPPVHTMGGTPPVGYHTWHAFMRAMMFLGVDPQRWAAVAPLNGFGWAVQSVAKPNEQVLNPPLPDETVRKLASYWLRRSPQQLDTDFQSFPYPQGIS